ncbi:MAG: hypothetical protein MJ252_06110 [archaeon]|nr:hypothetical protein [archaeon]
MEESNIQEHPIQSENYSELYNRNLIETKENQRKGTLYVAIHFLILIGFYFLILFFSSFKSLNETLKVIPLDEKILCKSQIDKFEACFNKNKEMKQECISDSKYLEICFDNVYDLNPQCGQYISEYVYQKKKGNNNLKKHKEAINECIKAANVRHPVKLVNLMEYLNKL